MTGAIYAAVARAQRSIEDDCFNYRRSLEHDEVEDIDKKVTEYKNLLWDMEEKKHLERCKMVFRFNMAALQEATAKHISIRPKDDFEDWPCFRAAIERFVQSELFSAVVWSFEQKGEREEDLGNGFHAHIVVRPKPGRYNSHILRALRGLDILGTMCGDAGVQIDTARTPTQLIQGYLLDYVSPSDEHKAATREWDALWRTREGLQPIYGNLTAYGVQLETTEPSP